MFRSFRPPFALCLAAFSICISGCGTIYDRTYSYHKNHFKAPAENKIAEGGLTAEQVLQQTDARNPNNPAGLDAPPPGDAGLMQPPPADAGTMPGMAPAPGAPAPVPPPP